VSRVQEGQDGQDQGPAKNLSGYVITTDSVLYACGRKRPQGPDRRGVSLKRVFAGKQAKLS
jgi:hypothetical protein